MTGIGDGYTRDLLRALRAQGWKVSMSRGGHLRLQSPTGAVVFSSATPSDHRAVKNLRSTLRRHGATI